MTSSRLLKLEMENQALLKTVEELKARGEAGTRILKAEKENLRLSQKVRSCVMAVNKTSEDLIEERR